MININELRLGSAVLVSNKVEYITAIPNNGLVETTGMVDAFEVEKLQPVPLADEILEKIGFVKDTTEDENNWMFLIYPDIKTFLCINATTGATALFEFLGESSHYTFTQACNKYLHQLQNLFLALTGEDLNFQ
jgi:hypothetical protein